ncbi:nicotinate-nucleotide adenylyltransferase [Serpentinicella sp. ANB-PHB4]|uniref:nicotinate-nucleotide adenylyltransferase n=1 Tax=Serpentinicella sp. ANB-PHB4 TaxID=3074076 RepID=UPI0028606CB6|nr:nicotinate-nucleotide adenylyltransferase [Serpentinicella sp. ANB-PHB4]MDR5658042.1 nicotinate-nucleotide adenylyltransferase [Serpentinicella sp. ANB-PHB4]
MEERTTMNKLGIMGGTFDPIHIGHLFIAQTALSCLKLDKVLFIPTGITPHKNNQEISSPLDRFNMTSLAINNNNHFDISSIEIDKNERSYTIDTILELQIKYHLCKLYFITGTDTLISLEKWKKFQELFKAIDFIVITRPGYDTETLEEKIQYYTDEYCANITKINVPLLDISSTDIRMRVRHNKSIKYLVPQSVEKYIYNNNLYTNEIGDLYD